MFVRMSHRYKTSMPIYLDVYGRWINKIIRDTRKLSKFLLLLVILSIQYKELHMIKDVAIYLSRYLIVIFGRKYTKSVDIVQLGRTKIIRTRSVSPQS